jgi:hypothetical protein
VTPWHKYVHSLLCKYGVDVERAAGRVGTCKSHINHQVKKLHADRIACDSLQHSTLSRYITHVHPTHADKMRFKMPRPILCSEPPFRGIELLMRVRMGSLCVHEHTSQYGVRRADRHTTCPCCGAKDESLSHLMFDCAANRMFDCVTSAQRDSMFDAIKSVSDWH